MYLGSYGEIHQTVKTNFSSNVAKILLNIAKFGDILSVGAKQMLRKFYVSRLIEFCFSERSMDFDWLNQVFRLLLVNSRKFFRFLYANFSSNLALTNIPNMATSFT